MKPSPAIFKARGLKPDVCLEVFGTDFHVHSTILKLYSHFFFTFFDSADKSGGSTGSGCFKYEWVTKVVDDGKDWQLVCKGPNAGQLNSFIYQGDQEEQVTAFSKLLSAIYGQPYCLSSCEEFITITSLARFYVALSALSKSLHAANLHRDSLGFRLDIPYCSKIILAAAAELRHSDLFRDALIFSLGPFKNPAYRHMPDLDSKLVKVCKNAYKSLCAKIAEAHSAILDASVQFEDYRTIQEIDKDVARIADSRGYTQSSCGYMPLPLYYRKLVRKEGLFDDVQQNYPGKIANLLWPLMENNLAFYPAGEIKGRYKDTYFLCVTIDDEDLPWDTTQIEW